MEKLLELEDIYLQKFISDATDSKKNMGHFNLFHLEPYAKDREEIVSYRRKDYYKIMLVRGKNRVQYADRLYDIKKQALCYSNPMIPYQWDALDKAGDGIYCTFNDAFFLNTGDFKTFDVFQSLGSPIFELTDVQAQQVSETFGKIQNELNTEYRYKYDLIRNLIFELIHFGLKLRPKTNAEKHHGNGSYRVVALFIELLERQFPIDEAHTSISLRSPSDFANQLNIHVNHLNRSVKEVKQMTTSQLIAQRVLKESKILLKQNTFNVNVSKIASSLGFSKVTHFNNFFKKHTKLSPTQFRKLVNRNRL
jgi:AraC-like DNA-binding protein